MFIEGFIELLLQIYILERERERERERVYVITSFTLFQIDKVK